MSRRPSSRSDPAAFRGSGRLLAEPDDYPDALAALVRGFGERAGAGYVLLHRPPPTGERDGAPRCRETWRAVEPAFVPTWTGWTNERADRRWHRTPLPDATDALTELAELTDSGAGARFVHTLALARDSGWTLVAVPHHVSAFVEAGPDGSGRRALGGVAGCLVGRSTQVEWDASADESNEGRYRVEDGWLRVERDGHRHDWSLARLRHVDRQGDTLLRLTWAARSADGPLGRAAMALLGGPEPPTSLRFRDPGRRDAVADALGRITTAYPPASIGTSLARRLPAVGLLSRPASDG